MHSIVEEQYAAHQGVQSCELSKCGCHGKHGTPVPKQDSGCHLEDWSCRCWTRRCLRELQDANKGELNPKRSRDNLQQDAQRRSPMGRCGWHLRQHGVRHGEGARKTRLEERLPRRCRDGSTPHIRGEQVFPRQGDPVGHHRGSIGHCFRVHQRPNLTESDLQHHSSPSSLVPCKFAFVCARTSSIKLKQLQVKSQLSGAIVTWNRNRLRC